MHQVCISSAGLYTPPDVITNAELVDTFNQFADLDNASHAEEIAAGTCSAVPYASVEFIQKACLPSHGNKNSDCAGHPGFWL